MNIQTAIIPITWLSGMHHGYGNGYIGLPPEHPWFKKDYDDINEHVNIHGGLTYASENNPTTRKPDSLWWIGFDTAHFGDNQNNCPLEYVQSEVLSLAEQAVKASSSHL